MQFVNPYLLFGLFAVAVPVVIHLFNFRRFKRVYFTNVRFIKDIQLQTQKQSRLKHLIILALRILAVISVVLAFSQPFIPFSAKKSNREAGSAISIYVDNSFSMEAQSDQGQLLDNARVRATEIASAYKPSDLYQILTNDFEGIHQHLGNRDEFSEFLDNVTISPAVKNLSEVQRRQIDLLANAPTRNKLIYIVSDFQKATTDIEKFSSDTSIEVFLVPLKANKTPNIFIDSCWFESPVHQAGQNVKLMVRIKNKSAQDYEKVPLKLMINGNQKAVSSFNLPAGTEIQVVLTYNDKEPGIRFGSIEIIDSPVVYDDKFFFSYTVTNVIPILTIDGGAANIYLSSLLGKDSAFAYMRTPENSVDYSSFAQYRLIILDELKSISTGLAQEVQRFISNGGSVFVIPSADADLNSYNSFLSSLNAPALGDFIKVQQKVAKINLEHPVYRDVFDFIPENIDLPAVFGYYQIGRSARTDQEALLTMQNGDVLLGVQAMGSGFLYLLASPLDKEYTSLPQHAIFVPTFYKIALLSQPQNHLFYVLGKNERIELRNAPTEGDNVIRIKKPGSELEFIPEQTHVGNSAGLFVHDQVKEAGNYVVMDQKNELMGISFNYDRAESDVTAYTAAELKEMATKAGLKNVTVIENTGKNLTTVIEELNLGTRLWKLFIILALVCLAAEVALLRLWK
jgi:hypothetical protein